jgi:hypothetical protein
MATIDSVVRMLNRRLREVFDYFGYKSPEYQALQSILYTNFNESGFIVRGGGTKAARLSRSKVAMEAYKADKNIMEDVDLIYNAIKRQGTVKEMAERYVRDSDNFNGLFTNKVAMKMQETIKERAYTSYLSKFNDDDIYQEVQDEMSSIFAEKDSEYREDLTNVYSEFFKRPGKGNLAGMQEKYDQIQRDFDDAKRRMADRLSKKPIDEGIAEVHIEVRDPYDMGYNP